MLEIANSTPTIKALIFAGDLVDMGEPVSFVDEFVWTMEQSSLNFFWVPGNNDFGRAYHHLNAKYKSLEGIVTSYDGIKFTGVGGTPASWAGQYQGERSVDKKDIAGTIFVSHVPPPGISTFRKIDDANSKPKILNSKPFDSAQGRQIQDSSLENSKIVSDLDFRNLNLQRKIIDFPLAHICGHIHHTWGVGYLGSTKIIKLAASYLGYYAIMDLQSLVVEFGRFWK